MCVVNNSVSLSSDFNFNLLFPLVQGGLADSGTPVPLTAYVLTALIEAGTLSTARIVTDATRCVLSDTSRDPYTIAVKAYALALAKHPEAQTLLQQLIDMAVVEENAMYWETSTGNCKFL